MADRFVVLVTVGDKGGEETHVYGPYPSSDEARTIANRTWDVGDPCVIGTTWQALLSPSILTEANDAYESELKEQVDG